MKKITYITISLLTFSTIFQGCKKDDNEIAPSDIKNITSTEGEGQIILSWEKEEPVNFDYVKVTYYDKLTKKTMVRLASSHTTELLIPNTRKKYGAYEFTLQPFSITNTAGNIHTFKATSGAAAIITDFTPENDSTPITLTADMITANSDMGTADGAGIPGLVDNDPKTFFHSRWNAPVAPDPHHLQIKLKEAIQGVRIKFTTRHSGDGGGDVKKMKIEGSNDGTNWTEVIVQTYSLPNKVANTSAEIEGAPILMDKEYTYLRLTPVARRNADPIPVGTAGNSWFNMSGLYLFKEPINITNPEAPSAED
ncbi:discoidin domain-containing protein [Capnocytophaga catalasegens]|uniref:F5/8 type C domain-containing protein n=1 Tax=Capnocytophaga catalasegens TaxID=1004260 RepID=A0AAV5AV95_9FLAO|nr:discoidin domain-containing protein [Capnocytophaga catalasegens]GIZ14331.1 hypothetical protein RCZ03_03320 [Capnocytophaga catalasegens]GJM51328.1 hypothetical protein RCZ15_23010 [Capnocytophaga catalasegens]GJM53255.1 hypothetical protein RCZ16_15720 [Capnocytophaga catalasegens]